MILNLSTKDRDFVFALTIFELKKTGTSGGLTIVLKRYLLEIDHFNFNKGWYYGAVDVMTCFVLSLTQPLHPGQSRLSWSTRFSWP